MSCNFELNAYFSINDPSLWSSSAKARLMHDFRTVWSHMLQLQNSVISTFPVTLDTCWETAIRFWAFNPANQVQSQWKQSDNTQNSKGRFSLSLSLHFHPSTSVPCLDLISPLGGDPNETDWVFFSWLGDFCQALICSVYLLNPEWPHCLFAPGSLPGWGVKRELICGHMMAVVTLNGS